MITNIQAVLFDLGDTLITTNASLVGSLAGLVNSPLAKDLNLDGQQLLKLGEGIEQTIGNLYVEHRLDQPHWLDVWQQASTHMGLDLNSIEVEQLCRAHLKQFVSEASVEPYSIPLLAELKTANIPLGLVSNMTGPAEIFDADLRDKGLAAFFEVIVWSCAVKYRKPDKRIFQFALERLNLKAGKHIVMVGDNEQADVMGGKAMGFTTVKVIWDKRETDSAADYVVKGPELIQFFQSTLPSQRPS
jgi:HAD superfamily hydrolase (TIGR01549 family)